MCLNELHDDMLHTLPPTDSRLRPDVRILEEGNIGNMMIDFEMLCDKTNNVGFAPSENSDHPQIA